MGTRRVVAWVSASVLVPAMVLSLASCSHHRSVAGTYVARAAGLHASRIDGSNLRYNSEQPWLPDILICPVPLAGRLLDAISAVRQREQ